jgi:gliding motility-associated lipoprotein GldH
LINLNVLEIEKLRTVIETKIKTEKEMRSIFLTLLIVLAFIACDNKTVVSETRTLSGNWGQQDVIEFTIPQLDSLKKYNMFLHLRNTNDYPFNNIFIIASINFPHGKVVTDTLEYRMAEPDGMWLGAGIGNIKESKLWFKENISFFESGNYTLSVSQAVRNNGDVGGVSQLSGITEVGYSIEEIIE